MPQAAPDLTERQERGPEGVRQGLLAALSHRGNRLDGVRLVLASMVLVAHSWPLSGHGRTPSLYGEDFGTVAVCGFFAISGYLITGSRMSLSLPRFAWHRFLRIYPGYWAVLLLTAFVFSRGLAHVAHEHWSYSAAIAHLKANWTTRIHDFALQGTLLHTAYTPGGASAWNGSSWTLYYEIMCYVIVGLLFTLPWARRTPWVAGAALLVASWVMLQPSLTTTSMDVWAMSRLGAPFAAGALMRVLGDRIPVSGRWAAVSGVLSVVAAGTGHLFPYAVLPFTYFVLWLGSGRSRSGRRADPSYGIYIYAFPVQEMLGDLGIGTSNVLLFLLLSAACVTPLAFASWHLVERPCMKARNWSPSGTALRLWAQVRARAGRYRPEERGYPDAKAEEA